LITLAPERGDQEGADPMNYCWQCGTPTAAGAAFCNNCGIRISGPVELPSYNTGPHMNAKTFSARVTPAIYILALFCFFLPFTTISCARQPLVTMTGIQLAIGTSIQQPQAFGSPRERAIPPDIMIILALIAGGAGLAFALAGHHHDAAFAGVVGAAILLVFKSLINNGIAREGGGMLQVEYGIGFWGAVLLYVAAALIVYAFNPATGQNANKPPKVL
jgi:hypothetical protein